MRAQSNATGGYRPPVRDALTAMAESLERFEGPDGTELFDVPGVYRRYARWWTELPSAEVRVLDGRHIGSG